MATIKTNMILLCIVIICVLCAGRTNAMNQQNILDSAAESAVTRMLNGEALQLEDIHRIQSTDGLIDNICKKVQALPSSQIEKCFTSLETLSAAIVDNKDNEGFSFGGYYNSKPIVGLFVELLYVQEYDLGKNACKTLATPGFYPDSLIRDYNDKILKVAQMYPKTPHIVRLIGVTGTDAAKKLIQTKVVGDAPDIVSAAMAKLGDRKAQNQLIERYKKAEPGIQKEELAMLLGYVNKVKTVLALASDFRTDQTYIWHEPFASRSVRVDIIKGLHIAFPEEPVFWKPNDRPSEDDYYEEIERWLVENLGVKWNKPRPPFLYEMDAPF